MLEYYLKKKKSDYIFFEKFFCTVRVFKGIFLFMNYVNN